MAPRTGIAPSANRKPQRSVSAHSRAGSATLTRSINGIPMQPGSCGIIRILKSSLRHLTPKPDLVRDESEQVRHLDDLTCCGLGTFRRLASTSS